MKINLKQTGVLIGFLTLAVVSCNSKHYNEALKSGSAASLYNPSDQPMKDSSEVNHTIAPIQTDSSGEQTGHMNPTGKGG